MHTFYVASQINDSSPGMMNKPQQIKRSVASHIPWVWEMGCAYYIEHALPKWYEAFRGKTQEQNPAGLAKADNIIPLGAGYYKK